MREILFRGKRLSDCEWAYGGFYSWNDKAYIVQKDIWDKNPNEASLIEVDPETVGQYTGLMDKNGDKIFEGNDVKFDFPYCTADFYNQPRGYHDGYGSEDGFRGKVTFNGGCFIITNVVYTKKFDEEYVLSQLHRGNEKELEYFSKIKVAPLNKADELEIIGNSIDNPEINKGGGRK